MKNGAEHDGCQITPSLTNLVLTFNKKNVYLFMPGAAMPGAIGSR